MKVGRAIAGAVLGFLFLLFVAIDLVVFGWVPMNSAIVTILPAAGFVIGAVLGALAGNRQEQYVNASTGAPVATVVTAPPAAPMPMTGETVVGETVVGETFVPPPPSPPSSSPPPPPPPPPAP
jgi:hypothetical protein